MYLGDDPRNKVRGWGDESGRKEGTNSTGTKWHMDNWGSVLLGGPLRCGTSLNPGKRGQRSRGVWPAALILFSLKISEDFNS
jgi:hypothetical protein